MALADVAGLDVASTGLGPVAGSENVGIWERTGSLMAPAHSQLTVDTLLLARISASLSLATWRVGPCCFAWDLALD